MPFEKKCITDSKCRLIFGKAVRVETAFDLLQIRLFTKLSV